MGEDIAPVTRWNRQAEVYRSMPLGSFLVFLAGVACLFGATGAVTDCIRLVSDGKSAFGYAVLSAAGISILWAIAITRRMLKTLLFTILLQFTVLNYLVTPYVYNRWAHALAGPPQRTLLIRHLGVTLVVIIAGYAFFVSFFRKEGRRFFAAHTEIKLASDIQRNLVPPINTQAAGFEFYGLSIPSGTVGGDLLDVITGPNCFFAYVADVAGHGVPAGVLMSMVKAAVRMRVASYLAPDDGLLPALNNTLHPLTSPNTYATFAYVARDGNGRITYSLAGHLPLLHFRRAEARVFRCELENLPVALFPAARYEHASLTCEPGDILALITDGLTEIFDKSDKELGIEHVERTLIEQHSRPLTDIASAILRTSEAFGAITDDRTLLLVRALPA